MESSGQANAHGSAPKCGAAARTTGQPCAKPAGWGTDHLGTGRCRLHGGNTPDHRKAAARQRALAEAHAFGIPIETNPVAALLGELARSAGVVAWLEAKLRWSTAGDGLVVDAAEVAAGPCDDDPGEGGAVAASGPAVLVRETLPREWGTEIRVVENPLLKVWRDERKHLADVAAACHRAGVEAAVVDAHQRMADVFARALDRLLPELGVAIDDRVIETVGRVLSSLELAPGGAR